MEGFTSASTDVVPNDFNKNMPDHFVVVCGNGCGPSVSGIETMSLFLFKERRAQFTRDRIIYILSKKCTNSRLVQDYSWRHEPTLTNKATKFQALWTQETLFVFRRKACLSRFFYFLKTLYAKDSLDCVSTMFCDMSCQVDGRCVIDVLYRNTHNRQNHCLCFCIFWMSGGVLYHACREKIKIRKIVLLFMI